MSRDEPTINTETHPLFMCLRGGNKTNMEKKKDETGKECVPS